MQLIVLGMHRSGTSSITRLLNLAGAYFGLEGIATDANEENPKGFWERRDVRGVCDGLLQDSGHDWWRVADLDLEAIPDESRSRHLAAMQRIVLELDAHRPWVVKEPRLCLLAPVIRPLLEAPVFVHVVREPLEIARSLEARNGFPLPVGIALWEAYTTRAFDASADDPRVLVSYGDLVRDPVATTTTLIEQLQDIGVPALRIPTEREIEAFVTESLHRHRDVAPARLEQLNTTQLALADALDAGQLPRASGGTISAGATASLRAFEATEDVAAELAETRAVTARQASEAEAARREHEALTTRSQALEDSIRDREARLSAEQRALAERRAAERDAGNHLDDAERRLRSVQASRLVRIGATLAKLRHGDGIDRAVGRARRDVELARAAVEPAQGHADLAEEASPDDPPRPIAVVREDRRRARAAGGSPRVAVLAWDLGHNPFGRAHLLADILRASFEVEIWGSQFERYGSTVWAPLAGTDIPVHRIQGSDLPGYFDRLDDAARRIAADAIVVSKARLPSLALGIRAAELWPRPLLLDVDDHEPAFFDETSSIDLEELYERRDDPDLKLPFGRLWTRACDGVVSATDGLTVSNLELQERYGGIVVPHARDENLFDPERYDRGEARRRLGLGPDDRFVLFGGTPRAHKGIVDLLTAVERLGDPNVRVGVFQTPELEGLRREIGALDRWILPLSFHGFGELPQLLAAADLSCALQDPNHTVSRYQMPAKATDAMAMGIPCLVTRVPPLQALIDKDLVAAVDPATPLHEAIRDALHDAEQSADRARRAREEFLESYSYSAVRPVLEGVITALLERPSAPPPARSLSDLAGAARSILRPGGAPPPKRRREIPEGAELDLVMFWKQNDTGLYGRRQEMFLRYLERSGRFRSIVHFDHPISAEALALVARRSLGTHDQNRLVLAQTLRRIAHRSDRAAVQQRTFVYAGGRRSKLLRFPSSASFPDYVRRVLDEAGIGRRPLMCWVYPTNSFFPEVADVLRPDVVVADVVDDNRTWYEPGAPQAAALDQNYADVLARSDIVLANCQPVADSMRAFADRVHVVPNACELPDAGPIGPKPPALAALPGPIIGYAGNLSDRIDLPLLRQLARGRPDWSFVFLGSTHLDRSALALEAEPNVHFLGTVLYEEAKDLIRHFDVGLIPHVDNAMTRSMNPLKAYVYCSLGVPIVATPVANLEEMKSFITVAEGVDEFIAAIEDTLRTRPAALDVDELWSHSWESRVEDVLAILDDEIAGRENKVLANGG